MSVFKFEKPEFEAMSNDQQELLQITAQNAGMQKEVVADVMTKYGPGVLANVVEFLRHGVSVTLVMQLLQLFGPDVVSFILGLFTSASNKQFAALQAGEDEEAAKSAFGDVIVNLLVSKLLPAIIERYGAQILQGILTSIIDSISKDSKAGQIFNAD